MCTQALHLILNNTHLLCDCAVGLVDGCLSSSCAWKESPAVETPESNLPWLARDLEVLISEAYGYLSLLASVQNSELKVVQGHV